MVNCLLREVAVAGARGEETGRRSVPGENPP